MKKALSLFLATLLVLSTMSCLSVVSFAADGNDASETAQEIDTNAVFTGKMDSKDDIDWYKFEADKDYFTISFGMHDTNATKPAAGWNITVYDGNMNQIKYYEKTVGVTSAILAITGTIYVKVEPFSDYFTAVQVCDVYYDITVNTVEDAHWESEYNDTVATANKITQGSTYKGNISANGYDVDYYKFTSKSSAFKFNFNLNPDEMDPGRIFDGWKVTIYPMSDPSKVLYSGVINTMEAFESRVLPYEKGKDYIVKIEAVQPNNAPVGETYRFSISNASDGHRWEVENGKTDLTGATVVKNGYKIYGNLDSGNDKDYYRIYIPASGKLSVKFNRDLSEASGDGWRLVILNATGSEVASVDMGNSLNAKVTSPKISKSGYYYVRIESVNGSNPPSDKINYNLTFTYTMTAPKISTIKNITSGAYIKWSKVNDCSGYYVYRKTGSGSWKKLATVKGESKVSYTDKSAKSGTKYSYKVCAYDGSTKSEYSSSKTITFLSAPKAKSVSSAKSGVTFTWTKVSGASGYEVYRATGSGSYKKLVTVKKGSTVKFVDKSAKKGKTYKYKVRAYKGDSTSAFSSVKTIKDKY